MLAEEKVFGVDLLKWDPDEAFPGGAPFIVAGNFPYNISSQILFRVLDWRDRVPECVGMFQKEVAERVAEGPGSKTYGILSVLLQSYYDIEYLFTVHEQAFDPPPKVKSGVIRLVRNDVTELPHGITFAHFRRVVKAAFSQRRKTLRNSIKSGGFDATRIPERFQGQRAEQLSVAEFHAALLLKSADRRAKGRNRPRLNSCVFPLGASTVTRRDSHSARMPHITVMGMVPLPRPRCHSSVDGCGPKPRRRTDLRPSF